MTRSDARPTTAMTATRAGAFRAFASPLLAAGLGAALGACHLADATTPVDAPRATATTPQAIPAVYGPDHVGLELPGAEVCALRPGGDAPVAPGRYQALLRNVRCDQQRYATMARLALTLGVGCRHCHAPHPTDPTKESYPADTPTKAKAVWMYQTFVQGLRLADGSPTMCSSCHVDPVTGKPTAKILGDPRDPVRTMEWMHQMTARFVTRRGERLRCKTCHQGMAPSREGWVPTLIGQAWLRDALAPPVLAEGGTSSAHEGAGGAAPGLDESDDEGGSATGVGGAPGAGGGSGDG